MKVKISFEIDYNLPEKTSREIKNVFMENIKVFYENNLPIAKPSPTGLPHRIE